MVCAHHCSHHFIASRSHDPSKTKQFMTDKYWNRTCKADLKNNRVKE